MSTMKWTNEWLNGDRKNVEYLFVIEKTPAKVAAPASTPLIRQTSLFDDIPQREKAKEIAYGI